MAPVVIEIVSANIDTVSETRLESLTKSAICFACGSELHASSALNESPADRIKSGGDGFSSKLVSI